MIDFGAVMKLKQAWSVFTSNHPKVPVFVNQVKNHDFQTGTEIAIAIRYPDGTEAKTGIRVQDSDLELLNVIKNLAK